MRIPEPVLTIGVSIMAIGIAVGLYSFIAGGERDDAGNATADIGAWQFAESTDPMTDAHTVSASRDFTSASGVVEAAVKCVNGDHLLYEFSTFDNERKGLGMTSQPDAYAQQMMAKGLMPVGPFIRFQARVDEEPAKRGFVANPAYVNELSIGPKAGGINSEEMARGGRVLIRLPTRGGERTVEITQTDPAVYKVLEGCHFRQNPTAADDKEDLSAYDIVPTVQATIPQSLIDMKAESDGGDGTTVVLSKQEFSTIGTSVRTQWLGKTLSRDGSGISVGLKLVQPQMWYYAIVHHSCKNSTDYRWEKFWSASSDDEEGSMAIGKDAAKTALQEDADGLGPIIFTKLCGS